MSTRYSCTFVMVLWLLFQTVVCHGAAESSAQEQTAVKVTVYNNNLGLIKDTRTVSVLKGENELRFMDVAAHILPATVHVKSLDGAEHFRVLEQNYEYDLMNAEKLLDKYVGKEIKIIDWNRHQDRKDVVKALLLSNNKDQIYRIDDEIYLGHPGYKVLPEIPENLIAKPTLTWIYHNQGKTTHDLEVSYLTRGISWKADYVLVLNQDDTSADLSGWVTLDNKSGATYRDALLKLVAGDVHLAEKRSEARLYEMDKTMAAGAAQFEEKSFFEYHIYDLKRQTTIKDRQTKQISLLEAENTRIHKQLLVHGNQSFFTHKYRDHVQKTPVDVNITFLNTKDNNLGMPLPKGIMRLYKQDHDGSMQFVGEDRIDHTPKDEQVRLKIGTAFDVVAERIQKDYRQLTTRLHESEWEIRLRNHKDKTIEVGIVEPLFGNWRVMNSSHPFEKLDAFTIKFKIPVPADGKANVTYRVQVGLQ